MFLTSAMSIAAGAWSMLRGIHRPEAQGMLYWGAELAAMQSKCRRASSIDSLYFGNRS